MPRWTRLALGLLVIGLAVACGDDTNASDASSTSTAPTASTTSAPQGPVVGPTTSTTVDPNCLLAADAYIEAASLLFDGRPSDEVVDDTRARFAQLDLAATADGCGAEYTEAVCDGLDELTRSGTLVIYELVTARCI